MLSQHHALRQYALKLNCTQPILPPAQVIIPLLCFQGNGKEYINILHLGGATSRIGQVRHLFRDDKLLVGFYTFTKDDPIAAAVAQTLASDEDGVRGGSIAFNHFGPMERVLWQHPRVPD